MFQTTSIRTTRPSKVRQRLPLLGIHNRDHAARIICRILLEKDLVGLDPVLHLAQLVQTLGSAMIFAILAARMLDAQSPWHGKREWNIQGRCITRSPEGINDKRFSKMIGIERSTWSCSLA